MIIKNKNKKNENLNINCVRQRIYAFSSNNQDNSVEQILEFSPLYIHTERDYPWANVWVNLCPDF